MLWVDYSLLEMKIIMNSFFWMVWLFICRTLFFAFVISSNVSAGGGNAVPVEVVVARVIELAPSRWVSATVISGDDAELSSEVQGRIVMLVEVGESVVAGQVVAKIDDKSIRIQLDEAQAEVISLDARLKFFDAEVRRLEQLTGDNYAAKNLLDEMVSDRDHMHGMLAMARARVAESRHELDRATVAAPFAGVVVEQVAEVGEWVDVGDVLVRLVNTERNEIKGQIQQESAALIGVGDHMDITSGGELVTGKVKTLIPVGDSVSRLYELRVEFDQPTWRAGRAVRIKAPTAAPKTVMALPRDALVIRENAIKVFRILEDQTAEAVTVATGIADQHWVEVIGDIQEEDRIVVRGNERLRPRQAVRIQQAHSIQGD